MIFGLLGSLFITIFIIFNLFIGNYIKTDALSQLNTYSDAYHLHEEENAPNYGTLPEIPEQPRNRTGTKAEVFAINGQYQVQEIGDSVDTQTASEIAAYLEENQMDLSNTTNFHLKTADQEYYITIAQDPIQAHLYTVFFVDTSSVRKFAETINFTLIIIMLIAGIISFIVAAVIANSVNRPVKQLIGFARQLGDGNFASRELPFHDKEFKELADVMNEAARQLAQYDHEQKTFFQNVSHEFRTPLMSINCYAEGIEHGVMEPSTSSNVILSETERLSEMVEDLLVLSRMDNATQKLEKATADLRETLSACAERLKPVADKNGVTFTFDFDESPVLFTYNQKYMARALNNLLTNALRYAKSEIVLSCKNDGNHIRLSVADDGPGIAEEELPHIFERFYKGENGGHGIGLSIVKSVITSHGGNVFARNKNGAVFIIEFDQ